MRGGAEAEPGRAGEVLDRTFAAQHLRQQPQAAGRTQGLEGLRELLGVALAQAPFRRRVFGWMRHPADKNTSHEQKLKCWRARTHARRVAVAATAGDRL